MSARISARLTTSFLLMAIAFLAFLLMSATPAAAHHKEGHENGPPQSESESTTTEEESSEGSETSGSSEEEESQSTSSEESSSSSSSSEKSSSSSGSSSGSSGSSSGSGGGSSGGTQSSSGSGKDRFEPDPVQTQTPPATKGPTTCPDYDDGNAGPYDHDNCDGSQGLHGGSGNGKCAGCTGKADDKWPGGQNVGDHNNGYECDHNMGVGRGNPAHSRCAQQQPPPPPGPCVDNPTTPMDECNPPQPCVDNPDTPKDECNPEPPKPPKPPKPPEKPDDEVGGRITPNIEPEPREPQPQVQPELPFTGVPPVGNFLWLALLLIGAGALVLWRTRDRGADA